MIDGANGRINWVSLNQLVDPQYNRPQGNIGTNRHASEIIVSKGRENSMDELTEEQKGIIDRLLERYKDVENNPQLTAECDQQIKQYIVDQYNDDGYEIVLMSTLPKNKQPEKGKLYLEKEGSNLRYIVETPNGKLINELLPFKVDQALTPNIIANLKYRILEETSRRAHTVTGPAIYNGVKLPFAFDPNRYQSDAEKKCYYNNPWHSAYRYFSLKVDHKPDPWLHPNAEYMGVDYNRQTGRGFSAPTIPAREMSLIHAMWLALNDIEFPLSDMHTQDTAKAELIKTLGSLARAHNWDRWRPVYEDGIDQYGRPARVQKTRFDKQGNMEYVTEEYDDMEDDKPSCPWGVKTRLTQFVMLALKQEANERILNAKILSDKFKEDMIGYVKDKNTLYHVIENMDLATLNKFRTVLNELIVNCCSDFDELEEEDKKYLNQVLPFTTKNLEEFINSCKAFFGDFRFTQKLMERVEYQGFKTDNYGQLVLALAKNPWGIFYNAINERIEQRKTDLEAKLPKDNKATSPQVAATVPAAPQTVVSDQVVAGMQQQLLEIALRTGNQGLLQQLMFGAPTKEFITQTAAQLIAKAPSTDKIKEVKVDDKQLREQAVEYALAANNQELAMQMLDGRIEDVRDLLAALQLSKEINEKPQTAPATAPILTAYTASKNQPPKAETTQIQVKPETAGLFVSEPAKQLLAILTAKNETAAILNQLNANIVKQLADGVKATQLPSFQSYNKEGLVEFLTKFALRRNQILAAPIAATPMAQAIKVN